MHRNGSDNFRNNLNNNNNNNNYNSSHQTSRHLTPYNNSSSSFHNINYSSNLSLKNAPTLNSKSDTVYSLWMGDISSTATDRELRGYFIHLAEYIYLTSIRIPKSTSGSNIGYAFIDFSDCEAAVSAFHKLQYEYVPGSERRYRLRYSPQLESNSSISPSCVSVFPSEAFDDDSFVRSSFSKYSSISDIELKSELCFLFFSKPSDAIRCLDETGKKVNGHKLIVKICFNRFLDENKHQFFTKCTDGQGGLDHAVFVSVVDDNDFDFLDVDQFFKTLGPIKRLFCLNQQQNLTQRTLSKKSEFLAKVRKLLNNEDVNKFDVNKVDESKIDEDKIDAGVAVKRSITSNDGKLFEKESKFDGFFIMWLYSIYASENKDEETHANHASVFNYVVRNINFIHQNLWMKNKIFFIEFFYSCSYSMSLKLQSKSIKQNIFNTIKAPSKNVNLFNSDAFNSDVFNYYKLNTSSKMHFLNNSSEKSKNIENLIEGDRPAENLQSTSKKHAILKIVQKTNLNFDDLKKMLLLACNKSNFDDGITSKIQEEYSKLKFDELPLASLVHDKDFIKFFSAHLSTLQRCFLNDWEKMEKLKSGTNFNVSFSHSTLASYANLLFKR